jgi:hypothetical protein
MMRWVNRGVEVRQRLHEIPAHGAAEAPGVEQHHVLRGRGDEQVIDPDFAELVHDDGGVRERRLLQQVVEQGGLAAAQKARDDRYRDLRHTNDINSSPRHDTRPQAALACFSASAE